MHLEFVTVAMSSGASWRPLQLTSRARGFSNATSRNCTIALHKSNFYGFSSRSGTRTSGQADDRTQDHRWIASLNAVPMIFRGTAVSPKPIRPRQQTLVGRNHRRGLIMRPCRAAPVAGGDSAPGPSDGGTNRQRKRLWQQPPLIATMTIEKKVSRAEALSAFLQFAALTIAGFVAAQLAVSAWPTVVSFLETRCNEHLAFGSIAIALFAIDKTYAVEQVVEFMDRRLVTFLSFLRVRMWQINLVSCALRFLGSVARAILLVLATDAAVEAIVPDRLEIQVPRRLTFLGEEGSVVTGNEIEAVIAVWTRKVIRLGVSSLHNTEAAVLRMLVSPLQTWGLIKPGLGRDDFRIARETVVVVNLCAKCTGLGVCNCMLTFPLKPGQAVTSHASRTHPAEVFGGSLSPCSHPIFLSLLIHSTCVPHAHIPCR